jgi:hypothetical protein
LASGNGLQSSDRNNSSSVKNIYFIDKTIVFYYMIYENHINMLI